ncbi:hypothetical protein [Pseudoalteromonas umbrosa]|uniref:hypothetical protein n=1 Tax=Pseudoalteromonas umbrosa TaxID=3048489 RepID=UPI0024C459E1|nr:hypothetical protein [Pseudoalteromonas sp. B95]MDK1290140.1 hypothetical protein [Pseudoalteromonas sp. B95]
MQKMNVILFTAGLLASAVSTMAYANYSYAYVCSMAGEQYAGTNIGQYGGMAQTVYQSESGKRFGIGQPTIANPELAGIPTQVICPMPVRLLAHSYFGDITSELYVGATWFAGREGDISSIVSCDIVLRQKGREVLREPLDITNEVDSSFIRYTYNNFNLTMGLPYIPEGETLPTIRKQYGVKLDSQAYRTWATDNTNLPDSSYVDCTVNNDYSQAHAITIHPAGGQFIL